jgi:cytochrome c-type biogenesis protein
MISYLLTFTEGILTFISPCILPLLPVYIFYLAGANISGNNASAPLSPNKGSTLIKNSIGFVIGFSLVFAALGATASSLGHFLSANKDIIRKISGIVMIIFGLNFAGVLKLSFLNAEKKLEYKFNKLDFAGSIVFGAAFGFGWTPCLGAFLGSALLLAANSETIYQGVLLLLVYSVGLGIPFVLTAVAFDRLKGVIKKVQQYSRAISIISGAILIAAGILIFTDSLKYLGGLTW